MIDIILQIFLSFQWQNLLNPQFYIEHGGLWVLLFVIFAETGLFAGFFLPGDSLLFVAGIFSNKLITYTPNDFINLLILVILISIAGFIGNTVGYIFGQKVGPSIYHWKENFFFKKHYLQQAHSFYEKHGVIAIVFARFVPIVRTFAPIIAGIVGMQQKKFTFFNLLGSIIWVASMVMAGHYLDRFFMSHYNFDLKKHLEIIVISIIFITTAPVIIKLVFSKKKA